MLALLQRVKEGKPLSLPTRPVVTLFSLKVVWSGKSLIGFFAGVTLVTSGIPTRLEDDANSAHVTGTLTFAMLVAVTRRAASVSSVSTTPPAATVSAAGTGTTGTPLTSRTVNVSWMYTMHTSSLQI